MKVNGPSAGGVVAPSAGRARTSGEGFSLGEAKASAATAPAARAAGAAPVAGLDALLALQETPGPLDRRKRAVKRASRLLDELDKVKLAMLEAGSADAALTSLASAVREARDETSDPGLESVLNEIETRAAVELAKREMAGRPN